MKWTSKSLGSRLQHDFFYYLIKFKLTWVARFCLYFVVFYYTLIPSIRKRCSFYLKRRFPNAKFFSLWRHCYKLYFNFANLLLDRIIFGIQNSLKIDNDQGNAQQIFLDTLQKDQGCIILSAHAGAWQLGLSEIDNIQRPINLVQLRNHEDNAKHYFEHKTRNHRQHPIKIISSANGIQASIEISTALQNKELVCIMGDRIVHESEKYILMPFLQGKIPLPLAPFSIASIMQIPLLITFSVREKNALKGVWAEQIYIPKGLHKQPALLQPYVQRFVVGLEYMVEHYPHQFFNFYNMWVKDDDD